MVNFSLRWRKIRLYYFPPPRFMGHINSIHKTPWESVDSGLITLRGRRVKAGSRLGDNCRWEIGLARRRLSRDGGREGDGCKTDRYTNYSRVRFRALRKRDLSGGALSMWLPSPDGWDGNNGSRKPDLPTVSLKYPSGTARQTADVVRSSEEWSGMGSKCASMS